MNIIADHPSPEMYASGLEIDAQCARCGSSIYSDHSDRDLDESGRHCIRHECLSSPKWCNANPLPGREQVERGKIEWFTFEERQ